MSITFPSIPYALVNGQRHSWPSLEIKLNKQIVIGAASIEYERTRARSMVYGTSPDPIGKTRGQNAYKCTVELYLAEYYAAIAQLGKGYGDIVFPITVTYSENGFDTITDTIVGCTLDTTNGGGAKGTEALTRKFECNPVKIYFNGVDDLGKPLVQPPS